MVTCGCAAMRPAGHDVRITNLRSQVIDCVAVGNISVPATSNGDVEVANAKRQFRNQVSADGGDVGLVTRGGLDVPAQGIAYRCADRKAALASFNRGVSESELGDMNSACSDWQRALELGGKYAQWNIAEHCSR